MRTPFRRALAVGMLVVVLAPSAHALFGFIDPTAPIRIEILAQIAVIAGQIYRGCDQIAGFTREIQRTVIEAATAERLTVRTDPRASPTGYPFKVAMVDAQPVLHSIRTRVCDLGYLRTAVRNDAGKIIYRCPSEPIDDYAKKGGAEGDTADRQCLCNALMSCIGMGQEREGYVEPPIVTSGDDVQYLNRFLQGRDSYRAADVIAYLTRTALVPA